ncbi:MAG: glycosyltransferase [Candidatus Omnitrophica bacterium]|nr:glycosyltransferase [Candidatus Omnitrophota bacterium]
MVKPMKTDLDIVIPVYNEGENIINVLAALKKEVKTPFRVLICYDSPEDTTLRSLDKMPDPGFEILRVQNRGKGAHGAVITGFQDSSAPAVLVFPADDTFNAEMIDSMFEKFTGGADIVAASRFMPGGCMEGAPFMKDLLVRVSAFTLYHLARVPCHDSSNGFRLFSRRVIEEIPIESSEGFVYSIELLVKCHRLKWNISEVPAKWIERTSGESRFRLGKWLPSYLKWFFYAFTTTYLGKKEL